MPAPLVDRVRATIREHRLLEPADGVLVGLSGGPDSVALLHVLLALGAAGEATLVGVAHLNHQLRGSASDDDERFCRELAGRLGLPIDVASTDVRALARDRRASIEATARTERYAFLEASATARGATRIAVGHTLDDQAETFLLKLVRGAGPRGLGGIYPRKGRIVRPLLGARRDDVLAYLESIEASYRHDATNADRSNPRNLVRHELLPWFRTRMNPAIAEALARAATVARDDSEWLARAAREAAGDVLRLDDGRIEIEIEPLLRTPRALARRIVRDALDVLAVGRFIGFEHVETVNRLAEGVEDGPVDLPGQRVRRVGGRLVFERRTGRGAAGAAPNFFRIPLSIPGEARVPQAGVIVTARRSAAGRSAAGGSASEVYVTTDVREPLTVRCRRPGDGFRPAGFGHRRKLQDLFVDRKVPKCARDLVPIVVDADDRIIWVVGHAESQDFRASESSSGVIILKVRPVGGTR